MDLESILNGEDSDDEIIDEKEVCPHPIGPRRVPGTCLHTCGTFDDHDALSPPSIQMTAKENKTICRSHTS